MTDAEWLACDDVDEMLRAAPRQSSRQRRLFAVACCRQVWRYLTTPEMRDAVEVSEGYADGMVTAKQLDAAERAALVVSSGLVFGASMATRMSEWAIRDAGHAACETASKRCSPIRVASLCRQAITATPERPKDQIALLRDIFGNPFRPVAVDASWLTSDVVALARGIYDDRAFDRMPILADALQDAGCDNDDILTHCRGDGLHVRGCWVVDLLLGKE